LAGDDVLIKSEFMLLHVGFLDGVTLASEIRQSQEGASP